MKLKQSKVFKAGIGYTIGNVMVKGINFLAIPIFSRLLATEEMGLYTVFAAYEAVLFVFIGMALHSSIRSAKYEFEGKIDDFTSSIMGIYWINLIVALFISIVFNKILTKLLDLDLVTLVMLVIYSFGIAVVTLYNARISLDYEYKKYIKVSLASTIGNVGLSLILIKTIFNSSRGFGRVLGITISTVLVTVYIIYDLYKSARPTFRKKYWKFGIKYSLPIIPHGISQVLLAQFDRIMINKMIGKSEAGIYGLVGNIKLILAIISDSISEVWMTWFYEKMKNKEIEAVRSRARQLCYFFLIIAIGVMSISPELVLIIGGQKYAVGKYVAIPMILDAFVLFIYNVIVPSEYFKQKTSFIMWGTMSAAVINIITNYIFIQKYGFIAAAYTTLFAYICYMILHLVISYRLMRFSIIPVSCIALCLLSIVIIAIVDLIFIDNILVRYLVCFAVVMFIGVKVLPEFVKENRRKAE